MNFIEKESPTKLRGGYYTTLPIARYLSQWALKIGPRRILEPSCGDGIFLQALAEAPAVHGRRILGLEINGREASKARRRAQAIRGATVEILTRDFLGWSMSRIWQEPAFDAVVGNPPFIRYQYLPDEAQERSERIFKHFRLNFTKHTNLWVPFIISSLARLRAGGRLAMVAPAEILHVMHAKSLRGFLSSQCSRILVLDLQDLCFEEALQGTVLLLAEKSSVHPPDGATGALTVITGNAEKLLSRPPEDWFRHGSPVNADSLGSKWMGALLTARERNLLERVKASAGIRRFIEIADVDVGIVTGANGFFLVPDATVRQFDLGRYARPMFGRSEHVPGVIYDSRVHRENSKNGLPTNFLHFGDERFDTLPSRVQEYIRNAEATGIHKRYKCRIRSPWYNVPSVFETPVGMLKRCHNIPRLVLNRAKALTTDTAYRIRMVKGSPAALVYGFVNSLTALSAELEGRHYGGGVLELVPSEIERLLVPVSGHPSSAELRELDARFREREDVDSILATQDSKVLRGVSPESCDILRRAARRLRRRRQRVLST